MAASPLPRYPRPEPMPAPSAAGDERSSFLILKLLALIAFLGGVYYVREKAVAFSAAARRAEERAEEEEAKRGIMGVWQCLQLPSVELVLRDGRFTFRLWGGMEQDGEYLWSGDRLKLVPERQVVWSFRCHLEGDDLLLWNGRDGDGFDDFHLLRRVLGKTIALEVNAREKVLRFVRIRR